jgi:predicted TPR repeat methyltransferase
MKIDDIDERNSSICDDVLRADSRADSPADMADAPSGQASRAQLLEQGLTHHEAGRLEQAREIYRRILRLEPNDADALHLFGVTEHQAGNYAAAIAYIQQAIDLDPHVPRYHNNLSAAYQSLNFLDDADRCVSASLALKPDSADAHYNLGVISNARGDRAKAETCFRQALLLHPDFAQAHYNLGILLRRKAQFAEAAQCFQQAVRLDPGNVSAQFLLAASSGAELDRAPDGYVSGVFDDDADKFDALLVNTLLYNTPQRLLELSIGLLRGAKDKKDLLDLGCGTGLAGVSFSPYMRQMVGVDLSARMLVHARLRHLYQRLEHAEMLSMMRSEEAGCYDVIVAADAFIYCGKLDDIFAEAKRLLRMGGLFIFSVESLDDLPRAQMTQAETRPFQLNTNGRFAHSAAYIHALALTSGFRINTMLCTPTRMEGGKPVAAWLVLLESEDDF